MDRDRLQRVWKQARSKTALLGTWLKEVQTLQRAFMQEVGSYATQILTSEGCQNPKVATRGQNILVTCITPTEELFSINYQWDYAKSEITGNVSYGRKKTKGKVNVLSMDPQMVAAEFIYTHRQGLLD